MKFKKGKGKVTKLPFTLGRHGAENLPGSFGERRGTAASQIPKGGGGEKGSGRRLKKVKSVPKKVR